MMIELVSPFPPDSYAAAWGWLQQFPKANCDDYGIKDYAEFVAEMDERPMRGEWTFGVLHDGVCVGFVGYMPCARHMGALHGIFFDKAVHGSGIPRAGVQAVLDQVWAHGVKKITACYFADNARVHHFLNRLGAKAEGYLRAHTIRNGTPIDMRLVAFFAPERTT